MPRLLHLAAAALILSLAGCDAPAPPITVPTPTTTPVFASDEEALAAAEEAYRAYLAVADQIFAEGGADPGRLADVATGDFLRKQIGGFEDVQTKGWHSVGNSTFDSAQLQSFHETEPTHTVTVYLCDDVSGVEVLGPDGASVVSPDRPNRTLMEVAFAYDQTRGRLLLSGLDVWSDDQC